MTLNAREVGSQHFENLISTGYQGPLLFHAKKEQKKRKVYFNGLIFEKEVYLAKS